LTDDLPADYSTTAASFRASVAVCGSAFLRTVHEHLTEDDVSNVVRQVGHWRGASPSPPCSCLSARGSLPPCPPPRLTYAQLSLRPPLAAHAQVPVARSLLVFPSPVPLCPPPPCPSPTPPHLFCTAVFSAAASPGRGQWVLRRGGGADSGHRAPLVAGGSDGHGDGQPHPDRRGPRGFSTHGADGAYMWGGGGVRGSGARASFGARVVMLCLVFGVEVAPVRVVACT
jgi:hypothetical protein